MTRRDAIKWILAAAAFAKVERADPSALGSPRTDARDLDLLKDYRPGELWPLTLSPAQRRCAAALCDLILPADGQSPGAAAVGVPDFIDEWISAPFAWAGGPETDPQQDRRVITAGLDWLDAEARRQFGPDFAGLIHRQQTALCDPICHLPAAAPDRRTAAQFFQRFRQLTLGGFYTTAAGMRDLQYAGNVPQSTFAGPPPEVLRQVGLL